MKVTLALLTVFTAAAPANPILVRETEPLTPEQERGALSVPDDFELQLFASEPMINKPINIASDARGRLWVSSTVEYPYAAKKDRWADPQGSRVKGSRDAIKILEDIDGDGKADKVTDFADGLNIPTGVLPWHKPEHKDGCIAWSIPNIWYFADTTGDGKADHREVLFGPLGYERDTHGMCSSFRLGSDGWVYATHGFNNTSRATAKDGSTVEMNSGNVFRFQPDGSRIEVWSRGQVNPFGLCFDRRGYLYSADCHSAPVYQLIRGAYYPSFGKPHDGMGFGPTMIEHTHGSTGICGIVFIDRNQWGRKWNYRMLIGNPVTSAINHDGIKFAGTTPIAVEQPDFMTSKDPWFRPVDLCLGTDGALYVADFYNRIIGHYEVPLDHPGRDRERGRIWRVVKKGGASQAGPLAPAQLSANPADDLKSRSPHLRRAAAAHLQQSPQLEALEPLLKLYYATPRGDTHLLHVVRLAIREHLKLPGAFEGEVVAELLPTDIALATAHAGAAAFLLDRLERSPQLRDTRRILKHAARHGTANSLEKAIALARAQPITEPIARAGLIQSLAQGLEEKGDLNPHAAMLEWGQELATTILANDQATSWFARPHPSDPDGPSPWVIQPRACSDGKTVDVISSLPIGAQKTEVLTGILTSKPFPAPKALSFWITGHRGYPEHDPHEKNLVRLVRADSGELIHQVFPPRNDIAQPVEWDLSAVEGQEVQLEIIDGDNAGAYAWLGITRIEPPVVGVRQFAGSPGRSQALQHLAALLRTTAPVSLRDRLRPYLPPSPAAPPVPISEAERARLDTLIQERVASFAKAQPDPKQGQAHFETHCARCHQLAGRGALLGPQLDGIGARGVERLCEDILDPNRNVDAHFYLTTFELKDGKTAAGFVRAESGALVLVVDPAGTEHRIQKNAIAKQTTTPLSLMPPTYAQLLPPDQFNDLLGWLLTQ